MEKKWNHQERENEKLKEKLKSREDYLKVVTRETDMQYKRLTAAKKKIQVAKEKAQGHLKMLKERNTDFHGTLQELKGEGNNVDQEERKNEVKRDIENLVQKIEEKKQEREKQKASLDEMKESFQTVLKTRQQMESELKQMKSEEKSCKEQVSKVQEALDHHEERKKEQLDMNSELQKENDQFTAALDEESRRVEVLQAKIKSEMAGMLNKMDNMHKSLSLEIDEFIRQGSRKAVEFSVWRQQAVKEISTKDRELTELETVLEPLQEQFPAKKKSRRVIRLLCSLLCCRR